MTKKQKEAFDSLVEDITNNKKFDKLNKELHHGISRYEHSMRVASWTYKITRMFNMKKGNETTRAALLHDFYVDKDLVSDKSYQKLGEHPNVALENSLKYFELDEVQQDIIKSHMFPCTKELPKYKESWLVSAVDKTVSTYEMLRFKSSLYLGVYTLFLFELIKIPR